MPALFTSDKPGSSSFSPTTAGEPRRRSRSGDHRAGGWRSSALDAACHRPRHRPRRTDTANRPPDRPRDRLSAGDGTFLRNLHGRSSDGCMPHADHHDHPRHNGLFVPVVEGPNDWLRSRQLRRRFRTPSRAWALAMPRRRAVNHRPKGCASCHTGRAIRGRGCADPTGRWLSRWRTGPRCARRRSPPHRCLRSLAPTNDSSPSVARQESSPGGRSVCFTPIDLRRLRSGSSASVGLPHGAALPKTPG